MPVVSSAVGRSGPYPVARNSLPAEATLPRKLWNDAAIENDAADCKKARRVADIKRGLCSKTDSDSKRYGRKSPFECEGNVKVMRRIRESSKFASPRASSVRQVTDQCVNPFISGINHPHQSHVTQKQAVAKKGANPANWDLDGMWTKTSQDAEWNGMKQGTESLNGRPSVPDSLEKSLKRQSQRVLAVISIDDSVSLKGINHD